MSGNCSVGLGSHDSPYPKDRREESGGRFSCALDERAEHFLQEVHGRLLR